MIAIKKKLEFAASFHSLGRRRLSSLSLAPAANFPIRFLLLLLLLSLARFIFKSATLPCTYFFYTYHVRPTDLTEYLPLLHLLFLPRPNKIEEEDGCKELTKKTNGNGFR